MFRNRLYAVGRAIERQSTIGRLAALVGAVVLFWLAQRLTYVAEGMGEGSAAYFAVALPTIVCAIVAIYAAFVAVRALLGRPKVSAENGESGA